FASGFCAAGDAELLPRPAARRRKLGIGPAGAAIGGYFDLADAAVGPSPAPDLEIVADARVRRRADDHRLRRNLPYRPRSIIDAVVVKLRRERTVRAALGKM